MSRNAVAMRENVTDSTRQNYARPMYAPVRVSILTISPS